MNIHFHQYNDTLVNTWPAILFSPPMFGKIYNVRIAEFPKIFSSYRIQIVLDNAEWILVIFDTLRQSTPELPSSTGLLLWACAVWCCTSSWHSDTLSGHWTASGCLSGPPVSASLYPPAEPPPQRCSGGPPPLYSGSASTHSRWSRPGCNYTEELPVMWWHGLWYLS